jgi:HKD family nuclease
MQDTRYETAILNRWNAGVPVRILVDPRANPTYTGNSTILADFAAAGIPMRKRIASGILHWKMMLFAGQNTIEFGSANYSPDAFVPNTAYTNYVSETVYTTDDPTVVNSFKTKFDDSWIDTTNFATYANISGSLTRTYPIYTIDPELNFPPNQSYASRAVTGYNNETQKIDVIMYRITDRRHTDAIINAKSRGVPIRMILENGQYHNKQYLWDSWNVDRLYAAGIPLRWRGHAGENHEKLVLLYGQGLTIFGSSNWTSASDSSQQEHNYFTKKTAIFNWFQDQFDRMWTNAAGATETVPFVPLPPSKPTYKSPANGATGQSTSMSLTWYGGPWAAIYDVYFGTSPTPPLLAGNLNLGPSTSSTTYQKYQLPTLTAGTTYYWQIVSKTMAGLTATGPVWSFTTGGAPPPPPQGGTTIVLWASNTPASAIHGTNWQMLSDSAAAGGAALWNPNQGAAKIVPALASPTSYWEQTFTASAGTAYHLWVRLRAQNNSLSNDSIHVQFNDSVDSLGTAIDRIGTTSSEQVVLQAGSSDTSDQGYGWIDNGWGSLGANIYFKTTGTHTIRIQQREDGAIVDQIVLSPDTYLSTAPGPNDNDTTILPANSG